MKDVMGIEARIAWAILCEEVSDGMLREPAGPPYGDAQQLDLLSAQELMDLLEKVRAKLQERGYDVDSHENKASEPGCNKLHITKDLGIFMEGR